MALSEITYNRAKDSLKIQILEESLLLIEFDLKSYIVLGDQISYIILIYAF